MNNDNENTEESSPSINSNWGACFVDPEFLTEPEEYLINYNDKYKDDLPTLYRDSVIQQTLSCLIGKYKPNGLLVGAAGVGKTKVVEDIARRIANNAPIIPRQLEGYTVWELPLSNIIAGSGLVGDVEKKTRKIIDFATKPENKVILFIDEIHMLTESHSGSPYSKIAQIMKPALARGDMKVIGATTLQESQELMRDPAFNRRFTRLIVDELTQTQTFEILKNMQGTMCKHYLGEVLIDDKVLEEVVAVADEYKTIGAHRPDNAITLLDRVMADALIGGNGVYEKPIHLSRRQMRKTAKKIMTGDNEKTEIDIDSLGKRLSVIKGQDTVLEYLKDALKRDNLNLFPREKPLTFLFAGYSGVGKTEVAKIIAEELTGVKPIILNMTEYHCAAAINRIVGAPAGYVGSDSKMELPFDILESNPYQVILLDEFEKADKAVQRLFMSAFDEGYIKIASGKLVDFTRSIIIATTNAGYKRNENMGFVSNSESATIIDLSEFFDIELLNRFTKILKFNPIEKHVFKNIIADTYVRMVKAIKNGNHSYVTLDDELCEEVLVELTDGNYEKQLGARPVKRIVKKYIEDFILKGY